MGALQLRTAWDLLILEFLLILRTDATEDPVMVHTTQPPKTENSEDEKGVTPLGKVRLCPQEQ